MSEPMVDVGVPDEEIETDSRATTCEDVVRGRDHLDAVDEPLDDVAAYGGLDDVAMFDAVFRADVLLQRSEVSDPAIPAHDFHVPILGFEASPEHLVPRAHMRRDRAAEPDLDLLKVLVRRAPAENNALPVLVRSPSAGQHCGRVVVVAFRDTRFTTRWVEVALLDPT